VLVPVSADANLGAKIAAGGGVLPQNTSKGWRVWEVEAKAGRVAIAPAGDDDWQLPADPVAVAQDAPALKIPFSLSQRLLVLAEAPSSAWRAVAVGETTGVGAVGAVGTAGQLGVVGAGSDANLSADARKQRAAAGTPLAASTANGLQAFVLPTTAADVVVFRTPDRRTDWLVFELVLLLIGLLGAVPAGGRPTQASSA